MQDLHNLDTQALIEMLAQQTALYTSKIAEKDSVELQQIEYEIVLIQSELNSRKLVKNGLVRHMKMWGEVGRWQWGPDNYRVGEGSSNIEVLGFILLTTNFPPNYQPIPPSINNILPRLIHHNDRQLLLLLEMIKGFFKI